MSWSRQAVVFIVGWFIGINMALNAMREHPEADVSPFDNTL